jgi:hypothetical protein
LAERLLFVPRHVFEGAAWCKDLSQNGCEARRGDEGDFSMAVIIVLEVNT